MNTTTNTTTANLFTLIKEKKTKWGISLDRNDKTLSNSGMAFAPFEHTSDTTLSLFVAATAIPGIDGKFNVLANNRKLNAIRACFLACKVARAYNGRVTDNVSKVLNLETVRAVIAETDVAESEYASARAAYTTAKRQYEARAELLTVAGCAPDKRDASALDALEGLREKFEVARGCFNSAKKNEDKLNWEIIRAYFPWFTNQAK